MTPSSGCHYRTVPVDPGEWTLQRAGQTQRPGRGLSCGSRRCHVQPADIQRHAGSWRTESKPGWRKRSPQAESGGLEGARLWECHELCVSALSHAVFRYGHALKRSSHMISNWLRAANHSRTFLPPFSKFRIAGQISLVAASPVGNEPRVLMDLRITRFRLSMAFVVQMILRIAGSKAGNGITSCHARCQAGAMEACFPARFSSNASSSSAAKSAAGSAVAAP